eukprot:4790290-Pleurochrysis_carterae.AAC.1
MQESDARRTHSRVPPRVSSPFRALLTFALIANMTATGTAQLQPPTMPHRIIPVRMERLMSVDTSPPSSAFALAADLLEVTTCVSLLRGHLLSAAWALTKACMFWLLHAGLCCLPGRHDLQKYRTYQTGSPIVPSRRRHATPAAGDPVRMPPDVPTDDTRPAVTDGSCGPSAPNACLDKPSACVEQAQSPLDSPETTFSLPQHSRPVC